MSLLTKKTAINSYSFISYMNKQSITFFYRKPIPFMNG